MSPAALAAEPLEKRIGRTVVRLIQDDLTALPVDAFVFYAREDLQFGSGYGTAIQSRGGAAVKKAIEGIGRLRMGEAVITPAGALTASYIIHACGPKFQEPDREAKLRTCMKNALQTARQHGIRTLAFPAMGAGFYGVPLELCARVMLEEIAAALAQVSSLEEVTICVVDRRELRPFQARFEKL